MANGPHIATQCQPPASPYVKAAKSVATSTMAAVDARPEPSCEHCAAPVATGQRFCCEGCRHAASIADSITQAAEPPAAAELACDLQGLHCASCVKTIETLFARQPGARHIRINPTLGQAHLSVEAAQFRFDAFARALSTLGYRLSPRRRPSASVHRSLLIRLGVCLALAGNSMVFSFAVYFGLAANDGALYQLIGGANLVLATLSLAVGGSYFIKNALASVRARVWHVDVPLALSVVLGYAGSTWVFFAAGGGATYFDTFTAYVALMLLGKYLPARMIERNRATLLEDDALCDLPQSKLIGGAVTRSTAGRVVTGDRLLVLPGDLLSVDARLCQPDALCSLDWINGEAEPISFSEGERVPAGAFNVGPSAFLAEACDDFAASRLHAWLGGPERESSMRDAQALWLERFARWFVAGVFAVGALTFVAWLPFDPERGLWATVCVLIVACPCAIGLGSPLALEMSLRRLRNAGVFMRRHQGLEKLAEVEAIAFDKTGTLTEIAPSPESSRAVALLAADDRAALAAISAESNHPAARAVRATLEDSVARSGIVREIPGRGLCMNDYELVRSDTFGHVLAFRRAGQTLATLALDERLRADAASELRRLVARGYRLAVLSGDRHERVERLTSVLPIEPARCRGEQSPEEKAAWIAARPSEKTLVLGDGINDLPAFAAAFASGTPAIDRPFVPARSDFYYRARGLWPIREALAVARAYTFAVRFNYGFALAYNAFVLSLAATGRMTPLLAAILMPASSLFIVGLNALIVGRKERAWRS